MQQQKNKEAVFSKCIMNIKDKQMLLSTCCALTHSMLRTIQMTYMSYTANKKGFKKGFRGFSVCEGFTVVQKTLTYYLQGFSSKRFFGGFHIFRR